MSDSREEAPRTLSTAIPAIPQPAATPAGATEDDARARIAALEREARALGNDASAALLFHEMGLLWEAPLKHPRNAAVAYQQAFKLAPRFLANIRAARRLFGEVGNWQMVVTLLDAELAATEARRSRAALLFEKGQVLEQRLSRLDDAGRAIAECLELQPEDVTLLVHLEQHYGEKENHEALVTVYRALAAHVTEPAVKAGYLTSAGLLLEDRLRNVKGAAEVFREAFSLDRKDPQLLAAMKRVAHREETVDEELAALTAEAELQGSAAAPTFLQISRTWERLGRPQDALSALVAARRVSPSDPLVLAELARIYEAESRFDELADVLLSWVQGDADEAEFVSLSLRLAALYEQQRRDVDAAGRYHAILNRVPGHLAALASLGRLHYRAQNWQGLVDTYEAEAAAADEPAQKAARLYKAGETLEERLDRADDAIARYHQALQLSPGFLPAHKALVRLYEKLSRWGDLVALFENDLLLAQDREEQLTTQTRIAALYEERLNDTERAIDAYRRVLELSPDHLPTMRALERLYEKAGRFNELLELYEHESRLAPDTRQIVSLAHRSAEVIEEHLNDRPAAIQAWERVLQLSPAYLPALRALGRLYGQDSRWDALIRMYRAEAELAPSTEAAAALVQKVGELFEQKIKDVDEAISAYREVLTLSPTHVPALRALGRIYRLRGDWESLIEILRAEAANRSDPTERANAIFQSAAIWEDQLGRPDAAIEAYQEVLRLAPSHTTALQQLERMLTARDDVKELIVLLDRQTQTGTEASRIAAHLKLARLYLDRLNEAGRAAQAAEHALAMEPGNLSALRLLERIRANDRPRRAELRARIARAIGDQKLSAAISLANHDNATPPEEVLAQLKAAYLADPTDEALSLVLESALRKAGDAAGLVELFEQRLSTAGGAADHQQLLLRIGELQLTKLNNPRAALSAFERVLEPAPELYPALLGKLRAHQALQEWTRARETVSRMAAGAKDRATAISVLLEGAKAAQLKEGNSEGARALYQEVLARDPLNGEAGAALEDLLAAGGGAEELALLREKRAEGKLAQRDLPGAAAQFFDAAQLRLELGQRREASNLVDRALLATPSHTAALELKSQLALEEQNYAEAAAALAVRVQQGGEPKALARLNLKLGGLYHDHLSDLTRAAAHLQTALSAEPNSLEALERLAGIHIHTRNWTGAADCIRRLLELDTTRDERAKHTLALAKISDEGFGDIATAVVHYRKVLELVPGDAATLDRLATLYERTGSLPELAAMLEQQAGQAPDVKKAVALKLRVASLCARSLNDAPRAIATLRQVLELDSTQVQAWAALAELYGRDTAQTALAVDAHRHILRLDPLRIDSLHALFKLWEGLRQTDKAFCAAALLVFLQQADDAENAYYQEGRGRLSNDVRGALTAADVASLHPAAARTPLADVLRAVGDQFVKLQPPQFELLGIDKKADRLKNDHAAHKALSAITSLFGLSEFELFQAKRGLVFLETTEPLGVCLGPDVIKKFNLREQRFLYGRAAMGLFDKTAIVRRFAPAELGDVLGSSVRIHFPTWEGLGRKSEDQSKQLRRAYSRRAIKALEEPAAAAAQLPRVQVEPFVQGLMFAADRAGLIVSADPLAGLSLMLREELPPGAPKPEGPEAITQAINARADLKDLLAFAVTDDFFRLRQRVGVSL